ncbi:MAG: NAD(P)H-quinone oxidoreductase subunit L [Thermostichales cyanobacterium BF4_bins_65]
MLSPVALVYLALAGLYLLVMPLVSVLYLKARWSYAGKWEKVLLCFLVFFFFPGLVLVCPFINFRPPLRKLA